MKLVSNLQHNHGAVIKQLLNDETVELFFVSPFLAKNMDSLFNDFDLSAVKLVTLVTTLKPNDQEQSSKPEALKSFYVMLKKLAPNAKVKIHIDNNLHGKIYIQKEVFE